MVTEWSCGGRQTLAAGRLEPWTPSGWVILGRRAVRRPPGDEHEQPGSGKQIDGRRRCAR